MNGVNQNNPNEVRRRQNIPIRQNIPVIPDQQGRPGPQMLAGANQMLAGAGQLNEGELKVKFMASLCLVMAGLGHLSYATDPADRCSGISFTATRSGSTALVITGVGLCYFLHSALTIFDPGRQAIPGQAAARHYAALMLLGFVTALDGVITRRIGFEHLIECPQESSFPMYSMNIGTMAYVLGTLISFYGGLLYFL